MLLDKPSGPGDLVLGRTFADVFAGTGMLREPGGDLFHAVGVQGSVSSKMLRQAFMSRCHEAAGSMSGG